MTLNAEKNTKSAARRTNKLPAPKWSISWLANSAATAPTKTPFMRRYFSATMIAGTITTTETTSTGR